MLRYCLRFIAAVILLSAALLKLYQLATAPLPPVVRDSMFTPLLTLLNNRFLLTAAATGEIFLAMLLFTNVYRFVMHHLTLLLFLCFTAVSFMKGLSGEASCGCFGVMTVNPWYTMLLDMVLMLLLACFRESMPKDMMPSAFEKRKMIIALLAGTLLTVPALGAVLSLTMRQATLGTAHTDAFGRQGFTLEPSWWRGKEFPFAEWFAEQPEMEWWKKGELTVMLVYADCERCKKLLATWQEQKKPNVVVVEMPVPAKEPLPPLPFPVYKLTPTKLWFADTPTIIHIKEGICVTIEEP